MSDKELVERLAEHTDEQFSREVGWGKKPQPISIEENPSHRRSNTPWVLPENPAHTIEHEGAVQKGTVDSQTILTR